MSNDQDNTEVSRPLSADIGWILLFIAVTAFAVAGMMGVVKI